MSRPGTNKIFRALTSSKGRESSIDDAVAELTAAWQLGIVTAAHQDGPNVAWSIDARRLSDVSGEGEPQAAEQLAAALAVAAEGLACNSYVIDILDTNAADYIDVFSTTYNALLARELGIPRDLLDHGRPQLLTDKTMDEVMHMHAREANKLAESHGIRRMYKLQRQGGKTMKTIATDPEGQKKQLKLADQLTVWRHAQNDTNTYKLDWYVELTDGKPMHIACSVEYGTEPQRAVIETYMCLANRQLERAGARGVAQLGTGFQTSYFGKHSPIDEFTTVFATTFLTPAEQAQIGMKSSNSAKQTDLLQSIAAVICERCDNPIQQFGSYGICLHCGDAQKVKN